MKGYTPKLPLKYDKIDGSYFMNKTIADAIRQDFKMLLLTNPGERVMDPQFGVGLKRYLFEQDSNDLKRTINQNILLQTKNYLNFINIDEIIINTPSDSGDNSLKIYISYSIPSVNFKDEINFILT